MRLHEIFPADISQHRSGASAERAPAAFPGDTVLRYTVDIEGITYEVGFMRAYRDPDTYSIGITFEDVPPGQEMHQAQLLFAQVVKMIMSFIDEKQPKQVVLDPAGKSREKLYRRLLQRYTTMLEKRGYRASEEDGTFYVTRQGSITEMSMQDLRDAEYVIEYLFKDLGLDVIWTTHFIDRIQGREADVTKFELADAFKKMKEKYGGRLMAARANHKEFVGVLKDLATELNIPFAIEFDHRNPLNNKYKLRGITIMRKDPKKFVPNVGGGTELRV